MTDRTLDALHHLLCGAIEHVRHEVETAKSSVRLLETHTRNRIIAQYGEDHAWRGLAHQGTLKMHDALTVLIGSDPLQDPA
jgi:hypothetical protein